MYESCFAVMIKVCKRYFNSEDESVECMNTSFMKVLKNLNNLKDEKNFFGWVKQITVNTAIDFFRNRKKFTDNHKFIIDTEYSSASNSLYINDMIESNIDSKEIYKYIAELPDLTRQVLNLIAIDGFNHREVGQMLDMSEESSRWHLHKARKMLIQKFEQNNYMYK